MLRFQLAQQPPFAGGVVDEEIGPVARGSGSWGMREQLHTAAIADAVAAGAAHRNQPAAPETERRARRRA
jgi:hypothetical protein